MQTTATPNSTAATAGNVSPVPLSMQLPAAPVPVAAPPAASTPQPPAMDPDLVEIINGAVADVEKSAAQALGWRIKIGSYLHEFRYDLGPKNFKLLLASGRLPFAARTAQTLARIGGHKALAHMGNIHRLPRSMTVLSAIAALPPAVIEQCLANGAINPETTLKQAQHIARERRAQSAAKETNPQQP